MLIAGDSRGHTAAARPTSGAPTNSAAGASGTSTAAGASGGDVAARFTVTVQERAREEFAASIPSATMTVVADATHYIHTERPDVVIEATRTVAGRIR